MIAYVDTSVVLALYVNENSSQAAHRILEASQTLVTSQLSRVEVIRNLHRHFIEGELSFVLESFAADLALMAVMEVSTGVIDTAIEIAASTGVKSLDAIHISSAQVALGSGAVFVTFDRRQAVAARSLGMTVLGVN